MNIASILAGFVKLANLVMGYFANKQLMDAGRSQASSEFQGEALEKVKAANSARIDAGPDGVFVDPFDSANRRDVPRA